MLRALRACTLVVAVALSAAACTVKNTETPPLTGPSELGLSLALQAVPDVVIQDGESRAQIVVTARDPNSQPVRNLALRVEISYNSRLVDYGTLSPGRNIVTGSDGKAVVTYTPPKAQANSLDSDVVTILVTPLGTDYSTAVSRQVQVRLVSPGVIKGASGAFFSVTPESPKVGDLLAFDGSSSSTKAGRTIELYEWNFGDAHVHRHRDTAQTTHVYEKSGSFTVKLSITDSAGSVSSATRTVYVTE